MKGLLKLKKDTDWRLTFEQIGMIGIVFIAMIGCFFTGVLNSYAAMALPFCMLIAFSLFTHVLTKADSGKLEFKIRRFWNGEKRLTVKYLWLLPLAGLMIGYSQGSFAMGNLIDLIIIGGCIIVLLYAPSDSRVYTPLLHLVLLFAIFYATSIWIEVCFPQVYSCYLELLTNGSGEKISGFVSYYTGFTTSPGYTAGYIISGIFVAILEYTEKRRYLAGVIVYLAISLAYTGMRMPVAAMIVAIVLYAFFRTPSDKRKKVFLRLIVGSIVFLLLIFLTKDHLVGVPLVRRTFGLTPESAAADSFVPNKLEEEGKKETDDQSESKNEPVTSVREAAGRSNLYRHAINLFEESPVWGIGWGEFRETVVGVLTIKTELDTHNIYLQLLCETGVIGLLLFLVPMGYTFIQTSWCVWKRRGKPSNDSWTRLLSFSLMYQTFFLVFGLTDNPLYLPVYQIIYLVCCTIAMTYVVREKDKESNKHE